ncbi:unnamed protein product [Adineta ricciae]|uniref:Uncharacterized protein n=1 Tax=Adineta ricciae TaxID=249248 RepID=A0A815MFB9_ADIRI|nr:unnamed protein product [Adineta ricciae]CAF1420837.1 unnamed protein product [Adineta ricciae]
MQCSCLALRLNAVGWNCNDRCQMIMNYSQNNIGLVHSSDTTYSFLIIPPKQPTTSSSTTTTTSSSTTTTTTTTSSSSTRTTSSSTKTTSSSSTTTTTTSSSSTRTTSSSTTTTTTTSSSSSTTTTATIQSLQSAQISPGSLTIAYWTMYSYSYLATRSTTVTLKFAFLASVSYAWFLDDISVRSSDGNDKLTNGNFEASSSLVAWSSGNTGVCLSNYGLTTSQYHSSSKSFYSACGLGSPWISQSLTVTSGQLYNVSFWVYLQQILPIGFGSEQITVNIQ